MIEIQVLMFAGAKEITGTDAINISVAQPIQAHAVIAALGQTVPELASLLPSCRLAVDNRFVVDQSIIDDDSIIALIPPVSGG